MMFMLGLMPSCTDAFFLTYPKMALLPPDRDTNFLIWKQIKTGRRGFPLPRTGDYLLLFNVSSERLKKPGIEFTTLGLQGELLNHYTTGASEDGNDRRV